MSYLVFLGVSMIFFYIAMKYKEISKIINGNWIERNVRKK